MIEQHRRDTGGVFFKGLITAGHEHIEQEASIRFNALQSLLCADALSVGCLCPAEIGFKNVVIAANSISSAGVAVAVADWGDATSYFTSPPA